MKIRTPLRLTCAMLSLLPLTGCFSFMAKTDLTWKGRSEPSTAKKFVCGLLDVATAPVQIPVWTVLGQGEQMLAEYGNIPVDILSDFNIYADRFARHRFYGRRRLAENPAVVFEDAAFLSSEPTGERAAFADWLSGPVNDWGFSDFQLECLADLVGETQGLADALGGLWCSGALDLECRRRFLEAVRSGRVTCSRATLDAVLRHDMVTREWLEGLPWRDRQGDWETVDSAVTGRLKEICN